MYLRPTLIVILSFLLVPTAHSQHTRESLSGYFIAPMDGRLYPSANFAETRTNHFHSGVDIKTGSVTGKPVYAAADGYVSRIGVAPWGFGNVLYLTHPNGTMTVYAHLERFAPDIKTHTDNERYRLKKHSIDLYPDASKFPVRQGDVIGYSGNTGRSSGPHLHYELRSSATQHPLNPVTLGIVSMKDDIAPTIVKLHYIEVDTVAGVPLNSAPRAIEVKKITGNIYAPADTSALEAGPRGYFVLEVTDRKNDTNNTMGVYKVNTTLDGDPLFGFTLDSYSYADTRYVNSLCHYKMQRGKRNQFIRLALQANNRLPAFTKLSNRGLIVLDDTDEHKIGIRVEDDSRNVAQIDVRLRRRAVDKPFYSESETEGTKVEYAKGLTTSVDGLSVTIPANSLYENIFFTVTADTDPRLSGGNTAKIKRWSPLYCIHDIDIPLHKAMTLSIDASEVPENERTKASLAILSRDGSTFSYAGGKYENGRVSGNASTFGRYCIVTDTTPPTVTASFADGADLKGKRSVTFTLKDDFSGVASFEATIDGQWILFEQNTMNSTITHNFDGKRIKYEGGKHELVLTVKDNRGNTTTLKKSFTK